MRASRDMALMNKVSNYLWNKMECSMGEIDIQLGIPVWKQYVIYRSFKEYFPDLVLERSRWRIRPIQEHVVVPSTTQDTLSAGKC